MRSRAIILRILTRLRNRRSLRKSSILIRRSFILDVHHSLVRNGREASRRSPGTFLRMPFQLCSRGHRLSAKEIDAFPIVMGVVAVIIA